MGIHLLIPRDKTIISMNWSFAK